MVLTRIHFVLLGSLCLLVGLFLPIAGVPIIGTINLLSYSFFVSYLTILGIAASVLFLYLRTDKLINDVGVGLFILYVVGCAQFEFKLMMAHKHLEDSLRGNPFGGLAVAATSAVHLDYGVAVLIVGSVLLIVPAFLSAQKETTTQREEAHRVGVFLGHNLAQNRLATLAAIGIIVLGFAGSAYIDISDRSSAPSPVPVSESGATSADTSTTTNTVSGTPPPAPNELAKYVSVQPLAKTFVPSDPENGSYEDTMQLTLQYHNVGPKVISAFKGRLVFTNQFGDQIQAYKIDYEKPLRVNAIVPTTSDWDFNKFENGDQQMQATPFSEMRFRWQPTSIIFSDGSRLNAESN